MKNRDLKIPIVVVCILILVVLLLVVIFNTNDSYPIKDAFEYPDTYMYASANVPVADLMISCRVPEETATQMTTEALVKTVVNYPLFATAIEEESFELQYSYLWKNNAAFRKLVQREDALSVTNDVYIAAEEKSDDDFSREQIFGSVYLEWLRDALSNDVGTNYIEQNNITAIN